MMVVPLPYVSKKMISTSYKGVQLTLHFLISFSKTFLHQGKPNLSTKDQSFHAQAQFLFSVAHILMLCYAFPWTPAFFIKEM